MGETRGFNPEELLSKAKQQEAARSTDTKLGELARLRKGELELQQVESVNRAEGKPGLADTSAAFDASAKRAAELVRDNSTLEKLQDEAQLEDRQRDNERSEREFSEWQAEEERKLREGGKKEE